jgi:hypothetical protein
LGSVGRRQTRYNRRGASLSHKTLRAQPTSVAVQSVLETPTESVRSRVDLESTAHIRLAACDIGTRARILDRRQKADGGLKTETCSKTPESGQSCQCHGPRGQQREGDQVLMSQRGPAPRPAPPPAPESPSREPQPPPSSQPDLIPRDDPQAQLPLDRGGNLVTDDGKQAQPMPPRTSGVHDILNPAEPRTSYAGTPLVRASATAESPRSMVTQPYATGALAPHAYVFQGAPSAAVQSSLPTLPPSQIPAGPPAALEMGSPTLAHPRPALGGPRRILTPKSPRVTSLSRSSRLMEEQPPLPRAPHPASRTNVPGHDVSPLGGPPSLGGPPQFPSPQGRGILPTTSSAAGAAPPRSLSQPLLAHAPPSVRAEEAMQSGGPQDTGRGLSVFSSASPFSPPLQQQGRGISASEPSGGGRWVPPLMGSVASGVTGARGIPVGEGPVITISPHFGAEILVPVDVHQASKQADEKRQRNAGASARFRLRKKEKEREQQQGMQKLEAANRELEKRLHEVEVERDFYRNDRNRLRELVARTPGISEWADRGPPSPPSGRSGGSFAAESGPLAVAAQHPPASAHPHPSAYDSATVGRPARRRRTEPEPRFATPSYSPAVPSSLPAIPPPSIPPPAYGMTPPPLPAASPTPARLPPVRFDQPSPTPEHPPTPGGPPPPPLPPQTQYNSRTRVPYEAGWATGPRDPYDSGHR